MSRIVLGESLSVISKTASFDPSCAPTLTQDQVHVWRAELDLPRAQILAFAQTLSEAERTRADRFVFEHDRRRFIARRGILREILGRYLGIKSSQVQIQVGELGKPFVVAPPGGAPLHFNLSHSNDLAVYAFARRRIGIDVEYIHPLAALDDIAAQFFSAQEYQLLLTLPPEKRPARFFQFWTRKEAHLKVTGHGLSQTTDPFQILGNSNEISNWRSKNFMTDDGYVISLSIEGKVSDLIHVDHQSLA